MSEVSRAEFDAEGVGRLERTLNATVEIVAAELVGLRTFLNERLAAVNARLDGQDSRFDTIEAKLDSYTAQVTAAIQVGSGAAARNERFARAIASHFGIELTDGG
jgi:hypothetical protein